MQIGFESFPTARQTTNNDSDFVAEISERANERPDMNGAAAFPSQINARVVTQIKNLHLILPTGKETAIVQNSVRWRSKFQSWPWRRGLVGLLVQAR